MFRDLLPLTALSHSAPMLSDATEEGRELKELSDLTEPALEPTGGTPGPDLLSGPADQGEGDEAVDRHRDHQGQEGVEGGEWNKY